ncbi:MAG: hypothetical protein KKE05_05090 [Nanoarchaeota archaeon]|nr:hypothetical protein [Nanoarchaeota archaeon]
MANVETTNGIFEDLGHYKSTKCFKVMDKRLCEVKFTKGKIVMIKDDFQKICNKVKND